MDSSPHQFGDFQGGPSSPPAVGPQSSGCLTPKPLQSLEDAENLGPHFLLCDTPRLHSLTLTPSTLVTPLIIPVASPAPCWTHGISCVPQGQPVVPEARALSSGWAGVRMRATPPCAPLEKPAALTICAPLWGSGSRQQRSCIGLEGCSFLDNGRQRKEAEQTLDW